MALKQILIVAAIVVLVHGWCCHACLENERLALLQLQASFINSSLPAESLYSWGKTANCCIWGGVECDSASGHVNSLGLSLFNVQSIPMLLNTSLFLPFRRLSYLYLSYNNIIGCVENEGFEKLAELRHLEVIVLCFNHFNNSILSSLSAISSLKSIDLCSNNLQGTINLGELSNLTNLEILRLEYNEIQDFTFSNGGEVELQELYLGHNSFNKSILSSLKRLSSLKYLDLKYNQLKGSLNMKDLSDLKNLETLDLSGNEISKFVASKDTSRPSNLSTMYLNEITTYGRSILLQSLGAFPYLRTLRLEYSDLRGARFGSELHIFPNLEELVLYQSSLDENFLQSLGALSSLKLLSLSALNGSLRSQDLGNLKNIERLDLSWTFILNSNKFFQTIGRMTSLKVLSFSHCGLTGILNAAGGLCNLKYIQQLDMSYNDFNGNLPQCLANMTALQNLDMSYNDLSGTLPWGLANLTSLQQLDLSSNHFMGNISSSPLSNLIALQGLRLSGNQFRIPISLGPFFNFSKLKSLDVSGNELYAAVNVHHLTPKFQLESISLSSCGCDGSYSSFLYHQHDLQYVDLSSIELSGEFPYWLLDNNTKLEQLHLANNSISGVLQLPIHSHSHLTVLDISNNCFSSEIPKQIGAYFPRLEDLDMSNNRFNGIIPSSFGNLSLLDTLDLSNNQLSGKIPEHLTTGCLSLTILIISNNYLQGQIFPKNGNLKQLLLLQLDSNRFNETIPHSLSNCSLLRVLDVKDNQISGEIPGWLGDMPSLQVLDGSRNNISRIELSCSSASLLKEVHLSKNMLRGSLPYAFNNCSNLRALDLSHNFLVGSIPEWIEDFSILSYLLLSHNNLMSEIPVQVCRLNHLRLIDLSNNHFSGHIPTCLGFGSNMMFRVSVNKTLDGSNASQPEEPLEFIIKGRVYTYQGSILTLFYGIDLSCNNLTGQIPLGIGNLSNIQVLNLSYNHLRGPIPQTFSNLKQIESLDLSHNNLEGKIPPQLTQLPFISSFSVAYNNLSGKTPERIKQFATFDNNSYEGNPFLCGEPLSKSCSSTVLPSPMQRPSSADDEDNGLIDMEVFYVTFFVSYFVVLLAIAAVLYINPRWRRAWFYFIEMKMTDCYYFFMDNYSRVFKVRVW